MGKRTGIGLMGRSLLRSIGFRPVLWARAWRGWGRYVKDVGRYWSSEGSERIAEGRPLPILMEYEESSGAMGAYFDQDLEVARWVYELGPRRHVDVGSRIDGFIGHLAVFREVEVLDIRPAERGIPGVRFHRMDLMAELPAEWEGATDSLSCLHTIEHFGLGRYGDPIDPMGHERGLRQLKRMVAEGGCLFLSTPVGPERVEFNAHRIFAAGTILGWFAEGWVVERAAVVQDEGGVRQVDPKDEEEVARHFGCRAGVLMVQARKKGGG